MSFRKAVITLKWSLSFHARKKCDQLTQPDFAEERVIKVAELVLMSSRESVTREGHTRQAQLAHRARPLRAPHLQESLESSLRFQNRQSDFARGLRSRGAIGAPHNVGQGMAPSRF